MLRALLFLSLVLINPTVASADDFIKDLNLGNLSDEAKEKGFRSVQGLVDSGNPKAMLGLGIFKLLGIGIDRNESEAVALFSAVASMSNDNKEVSEYAALALKTKDELLKWRQGKARLTSGSGWSWGGARRAAKRELDNSNWLDLALLTLSNGYPSDMTYYYLGRAAEGIGDYANAITYYNVALNPRAGGGIECNYLFDNCDGLNFPADAQNRIVIVRELINNQKLIQAQRDTDRRKKEAAAAAKLEEERELKRKEERTIQFIATLQDAAGGTCAIQHQVANMYFSGDGTTVDEKSGLNWLSKSAQNGCADAQYELSERYRAGNGLAKNEQKADDLLMKSSRQGYPASQVKIKELQAIKQERASQIAAAEREKLEKRRAAEQKLIKENEELESKRKSENINKLKSL